MGGRGGVGGGGTGGSGVAGTGVLSGPTCPGVDPLPAGVIPCRSVRDCPSTYSSCLPSGPTDAYGCGLYVCNELPQPPSECMGDLECGSGRVCQHGPWQCCGSANTCVAPCTSTSCPADQQCDSTGHCGQASCKNGYTCPSGKVCSPGDLWQDAHGCANAPCTAGYVCPDGSVCNPGANDTDRHGCLGAWCTTGYACQSNQACSPNSVIADDHGCVPASCSGFSCPVSQVCKVSGLAYCTRQDCLTDSDCDCGACLRTAPAIGTCYGRLGICVNIGTGGSHGTIGGATGSGGMISTGGITGTGGG